MAAKRSKQSSKEVEWRRRLARFAASGQTLRQFCQAEAVSAAGFYRWSKWLGRAAVAPMPSGFIDVGAMPMAPQKAAKVDPASAALEVRLELGHGLVLHIVRR